MEQKFFLVVRVYGEKANFEIVAAENKDAISLENLDYIREISPQQMNNLRNRLTKAPPHVVSDFAPILARSGRCLVFVVHLAFFSTSGSKEKDRLVRNTNQSRIVCQGCGFFVFTLYVYHKN